MTNADPCIAVVDDEVSVRTALRRLLRLAEYEVSTFESGEEFLASLVVPLPTCVILDLHMPGLSGFEVQARLRAEHIEIPVVFITASDDLALTQTALAAGGVRLLRKPFSGDDLLEAIGDAIRRDPYGGS